MSQKLSILYLYGWNGGAHSKGLIALQSTSLDAEILTWHYDQIDPTNNFAEARAFLDKLIPQGPLLVIGNSLGGYWANFIAEEYQIESILINPSLFPMDTLSNYKISEKQLASYQASTFHHKNKWLYLSKNDTVIDPHIAERLLSDCMGTEWLDEPHAIQDYNFLIHKVREWVEDNK
jgi:hypothetical protein